MYGMSMNSRSDW